MNVLGTVEVVEEGREEVEEEGTGKDDEFLLSCEKCANDTRGVAVVAPSVWGPFDTLGPGVNELVNGLFRAATLLSLLPSMSLFCLLLSIAVLAPKRDVLGAWAFAACSAGFGENGLLNAFCPGRFANGLLGVAWAVFSFPSFDAGDAPKIEPNCEVFAGIGVCASLVTFGVKTLLAADCSFSAFVGVPNMELNGLPSDRFPAVLSTTGFGENILPNAGEAVCSFPASEAFDTAGVPNMDLNG